MTSVAAPTPSSLFIARSSDGPDHTVSLHLKSGGNGVGRSTDTGDLDDQEDQGKEAKEHR